MSDEKGKIYADINRLPKVSFEAASEILPILEEAAKEFPEISKFYVSDDRVGSGGFRYDQFVFAVQKWQKKWLGSTKR
jgi:Cu/Ag efflux pump CusA